MKQLVAIHKVIRYHKYSARVLVHTVDEPRWWGWVDEAALVTPIEAGGDDD